jgi:hypothetical protein
VIDDSLTQTHRTYATMSIMAKSAADVDEPMSERGDSRGDSRGGSRPHSRERVEIDAFDDE